MTVPTSWGIESLGHNLANLAVFVMLAMAGAKFISHLVNGPDRRPKPPPAKLGPSAMRFPFASIPAAAVAPADLAAKYNAAQLSEALYLAIENERVERHGADLLERVRASMGAPDAKNDVPKSPPATTVIGSNA